MQSSDLKSFRPNPSALLAGRFRTVKIARLIKLQRDIGPVLHKFIAKQALKFSIFTFLLKATQNQER